jgi:hypothetical protein
VRMEVHDKFSLLMNWEVYAGLRLQGKLVDMIQLPDAAHEVTKPLERFASEQGDVDWFNFWLNDREDPDPSKARPLARAPQAPTRKRGRKKAKLTWLIRRNSTAESAHRAVAWESQFVSRQAKTILQQRPKIN